MNPPVSSRGTLIMAATHLGDPRDLPSRSLESLRTADLLVFEEDRPARSFLKAAGVHRDYLKYSEHTQKDTLDAVKETLKAGKTVAYMSDQGTAGLADPGRDLVDLAYQLGAKVTSLPGPSSLTAAIAACPFDCRSFTFLGFPPKEPGPRLAALKNYQKSPWPVVLMDTPYRLSHLIETAKSAYGANRKALLAVEISGEKEMFRVGTLNDLEKLVRSFEEKLNFILIVSGNS